MTCSSTLRLFVASTELNHKIYWLVLVLPYLLKERTKHPAPGWSDTAQQELDAGTCGSMTRDTQSHQGDHTNPTAALPKGRDQEGQSSLHEQRLTSSSALGFSK